MPNRNIRCSTGELPRRVMRSQRTRQRALNNVVDTENAHGNFRTSHEYRCLEIAGVNLRKLFEKKGLAQRIKSAKDAADELNKFAQGEQLSSESTSASA